MKSLILMAMIWEGCAGLSGIQGKLTHAHEAAKVMSEAGESWFRSSCGDVARQCNKAKDVECKSLTTCQSKRDRFNRLMILANRSIAMAHSKSASGESKEAEKRLGSALSTIEQAGSAIEKEPKP